MTYEPALIASAAPAPPPSRYRLRRPRRLVIELGRGRMEVTVEPIELEHKILEADALVAEQKSFNAHCDATAGQA